MSQGDHREFQGHSQEHPDHGPAGGLVSGRPSADPAGFSGSLLPAHPHVHSWGGGAGSRAAAGTLGEPLPQPMPVEGWAFRGYGEGRGGLRQLVRGTEAWVFCQTIKEAEHRRIDAFELWCWRRLLRVPWTARRSNQSILKISPGCSLEGLMLKLKLQYFGHLMQRTDSLGKTLMLGKIEGGKRRG